ncbi:MAG: hypothetical protein HYS22_02035 [Deltaproteobacteria bacterium]|nr:hypothetical protein [Deltaproteobacteria bacterium]
MARKNKRIEKIFKAKKECRKELARLPIEEKFRILLQLQKIASSILQSRGVEKKPWDMANDVVGRVFQVQIRDPKVVDSQRMTPVDMRVPDKGWVRYSRLDQVFPQWRGLK